VSNQFGGVGIKDGANVAKNPDVVLAGLAYQAFLFFLFFLYKHIYGLQTSNAKVALYEKIN